MPKNSVSDWDETAGNNTDIAGINIDEGCASSGINNAIRAVMAQTKAFFKSSIFRLRDSTDQTKLLAFDLSGITTATTRTLTAPNASGTIALTSDVLESPKGHIYGLTLSNNSTDATNDIDIAVGEAASDSATVERMVLASALTKRLDAAWAVGTGNGGLDTGAIANTTYHVWLIKRSDTGVVDALFSTSATAPTMPASYDFKRRIGSIIRSGAAILAFSQTGDYFELVSTPLDVSSANPGTSAVTYTLSVPTGIAVRVHGLNSVVSTTTNTTYHSRVSNLALTDTAASVSNVTTVLQTLSTAGTYRAIGYFEEITNTSAQVRGRIELSDAATTFRINTIGWTDRRGA